jgi:hypothetical protein
MTVIEIDAIAARLEKLPRDDMDAAVNLTRDAHVLARKVFGEDSPHVAEVLAVSFRPRDGIYNKEHYMNTAVWNDGARGLGAILKSMRYELSITTKQELLPPDTVTLPWLYRHLSWQMWTAFAGVVTTIFAAGFVCGRINLFVQLYDQATK